MCSLRNPFKCTKNCTALVEPHGTRFSSTVVAEPNREQQRNVIVEEITGGAQADRTGDREIGHFLLF